MSRKRLPTPNTEKHSQEGENSGRRFCVTSMQGWRLEMEDAHLAKFNIAQNISLFAVFDGHGGSQVAGYVAGHFESVLLKDPLFKEGNYKKALYNTFLQMDKLLKSSHENKEMARNEGCTACVALLVKDKLYVASAGDSRCVVVSKGGIHPLTEDHRPLDDNERMRIINAGGEIIRGRVNGNLNLSRAIGDLDYKANDTLSRSKQLIISNPDIRTWDISNNDQFLVIGCDGIWGHYEMKEVCHYLSLLYQKGKSLREANEDLLDSLLSKDLKSKLIYFR